MATGSRVNIAVPATGADQGARKNDINGSNCGRCYRHWVNNSAGQLRINAEVNFTARHCVMRTATELIAGLLSLPAEACGMGRSSLISESPGR